MERKNKNYIYFDHSATTPVLPEVAEKINICFTDIFGNASEPHTPGLKANKILEDSRKVLASAIGAKPEEVIFTGSGTESDNLAIFGIAEACQNKGNHIITTKIEHPAVHMPLKKLERKGFKITRIGVDKYGIVDPGDIFNKLTDKTILVSVMHANNIVGSIQPIHEIGKALREKGIIFHTDAVQTFCSTPIDVEKMNVNLLSISGHKIYGPKGVGALYIKSGTKIIPQLLGGGQEKGLRSSTENIPGISGLAEAARIGMENLQQRIEKVTKLRNYLMEGLTSKIENIKINGHLEKRLPGNCNFSLKNIEGESVALRLDQAGIAVSSGSACSASSLKPSHSLIAMGLSALEARCSIRVTLGFENTLEEVDYFLYILENVVKDLRKISPINYDFDK